MHRFLNVRIVKTVQIVIVAQASSLFIFKLSLDYIEKSFAQTVQRLETAEKKAMTESSHSKRCSIEHQKGYRPAPRQDWKFYNKTLKDTTNRR